MAHCHDHIIYHEGMDIDQMGYWIDEGIDVDSIIKYKLGCCPRCPTDRDGRPSYTIPVFDRDGKTLINIRHRLIGADNGSKYRPHMAGLGTQLFGSSVLNENYQRVIVAEGEKKCIILNQYGFPSVGTMGKNVWKKQWLDWFEGVGEVVVALDPDAMESAWKLGAILQTSISGVVRVAQFPVKPDDMIVRYGATTDDVDCFLRWARPVKQKRSR